MKKITSFIIAVLVVGSLVPFIASAQTVDSSQTILTNLLEQLLNLYTQELASLEQQLATVQANQAVMQSQLNNTPTSSAPMIGITDSTTASTSTDSSSTEATTTPTSTYTPSQTLSQIQVVTPQVVSDTQPIANDSAPIIQPQPVACTEPLKIQTWQGEAPITVIDAGYGIPPHVYSIQGSLLLPGINSGNITDYSGYTIPTYNGIAVTIQGTGMNTPMVMDLQYENDPTTGMTITSPTSTPVLDKTQSYEEATSSVNSLSYYDCTQGVFFFPNPLDYGSKGMNMFLTGGSYNQTFVGTTY